MREARLARTPRAEKRDIDWRGRRGYEISDSFDDREGEIEVRWPERRRRERPDDLAVPRLGIVRSPGLIERIGAALAGKRSIWR